MRLVDADALKEKSFGKRGGLLHTSEIDEAPTVDAVEVVRCKDIIYCKDCRKHNKKVGFDENFHTVWKEDACPLVSWRGKAQGHEFDYQFCAYAERRQDG